MTKFKVGDKVRFIEDYMDYKKGDIVEVEGFWSEGINYFGKGNSTGCYFSRVELVETKPTKNQRITALENEVAELKLIVHELRERPQFTTVINNASQEPSTTNTVEEIIEFEGQQYRKVDREAHEGDVVISSSKITCFVEKGKPYKVTRYGGFLTLNEGTPNIVNLYNGSRTPENVDVYELIKEGFNPQISIVDETIEPLTPNQQRAAIIEKAKSFVEETEKYLQQSQADRTKGNYIYQESSNIVKFVINEEKRTIVALLYDKYLENKLNGNGIAKCNPSDIFNEHIGKAIALGRALGLDVSEFEQAVQPNRRTDGMIMEWRGRKRIIDNNHVAGETCHFDSEFARYGTIINDTNAIYEVES